MYELGNIVHFSPTRGHLYVVRTLISSDNPAELTITVVVIVLKYTFLMIYSLYSFTTFIFCKQILVCSVGILFQVIIG